MSAVRKDREFPVAPVLSMPRQDSKREAAARMLGDELRRMRQERGLSIKDVAPVIRASISKISRMERGESPPRERDVVDLARFYGAAREKELEIEQLLRLMEDSAWWEQYNDVTPSFLRRLIGLEGTADKIYTYENHVVPGLLQSPDYARVLVEAAMPGASEAEIRRRVQMKMERTRLLRKGQPPQVIALLDEGVLRRPVGGAEVMYGQLEYLKRAAESKGVNIRILEFDKGASVAPTHPITHLHFGDGGPPELVYIELLDSASYLTKPAKVDQYRHVLAQVSHAAASWSDSRQLLDQAIAHYRRLAGKEC